MYAVADPPANELLVLREVARALTKATTLNDVKGVRDRAEAVRTFVKSAQMGLSIQNLAAEIKLRAERKAGGLIKELNLYGGDRKSSLHDGSLKLDDLGISHHQSHRWQKEATVPEMEFERFLRDAEAHGLEVTAAGLLRLARRFGTPRKRRRRSARSRKPPARNGVSSADKPSAVPAYSSVIRDLLREMLDHRRQLISILEPVCKNPGVEMKLVERRHVLRLLAETESMLLELGLRDLTLRQTRPGRRGRP